MDKLKTTGLGGLPLVLDDLRWFFGRLGTPNEGMYQAFNNMLRGFGDNLILQGVVTSGTTPNVAITEGWVLLDGELIKVDAQTGIDTSTDNTFTKVTTFDSRGNKTFQNAAVEDTYEKNRAVVSGTGGNLAYNGDTLSDLRTIAGHRDSSGAETEVLVKTKIIEIGDWNMDADTNKAVTHGFSAGFVLPSKIRSIDVMIKDDTGSLVSPLNRFIGGGAVAGGAILIGTGQIQLQREASGFYDNASYDSTSFNRGWITITYQP